MATSITDGEIAAERFLRTLETKAPPAVRDKFASFVKTSDWNSFKASAEPLLGPLKLAPFSTSDIAEVAVLTRPQQDIYIFMGALSDPKAASIKSKVDGLLNWGAWDSVAKLASSVPNSPFSFSGADVKRVFDPSNVGPDMSFGQAQAKTFLNTIASDPKAAAINAQVTKLAEWGGWDSIANFVSSHPAIPFKFSSDDIRTIADPTNAIPVRGTDIITKMQDVWSFYSGLKAASANDENVAKFFADIQARIQHGCWKTIADLVNGTDKIPFKGFEIATLQAVLDPAGKYGSDDVCSALAPPEAPGWTKPIVWTMVAGITAYNWTIGAADSVADWTTGAADDVKDWTVGAADSVADWTSGAASDAASWTVGAADTLADWTKDAASDAVGWTSGAVESAGNWAKDAATDIGDTFNPSNW